MPARRDRKKGSRPRESTLFRAAAIALSNSVILLCLVGCAPSVELERTADDLSNRLDDSRFYFTFDDGSESAPDNWDGHINLLWTGDEARDRIVAEQVQRLIDELEQNGFAFVEDRGDSTVIANLRIKSVRFDPLGGWITDDASLTYSNPDTDAELGRVVANEAGITPKLKWIINALVRGSLELWGRETAE